MAEEYQIEQAEANEKLEKGWILSRIILQIAGKPKDHVEKTLNALVKDITKYENIKIVKYEIEEATEEENMWTGFAEAEIITKDIEILTDFCVQYMPSSVEILQPDKPLADAQKTTNFLNDLLVKLHDVSMKIKNANAQNEILNKNARTLLTNMVFYLLQDKNEITINELSKKVGVKEKQLQPFLTKLVANEKLVEKEGKYSLK